jgi:hypothetical protein
MDGKTPHVFSTTRPVRRVVKKTIWPDMREEVLSVSAVATLNQHTMEVYTDAYRRWLERSRTHHIWYDPLLMILNLEDIRP